MSISFIAESLPSATGHYRPIKAHLDTIDEHPHIRNKSKSVRDARHRRDLQLMRTFRKHSTPARTTVAVTTMAQPSTASTSISSSKRLAEDHSVLCISLSINMAKNM